MSSGGSKDSRCVHLEAVTRRYPREAEKLPAPGEDWLRVELGLEKGALKAFSAAGIIEKAERDAENPTRHYWRTKDGVKEWIDDHIATQTLTPCGNSTGIHTLEPGTYTCRDDDCNCRMDRDTAEAVVTS